MRFLMMRGLPGSGKTTRARELVASDKNYGRVNRDDLRNMAFNGKWTGFREKNIIEMEKAFARILIHNGINPIIDDTNLLPKHLDMWEHFVKELRKGGRHVEFLVEDMGTHREKCIDNDLKRYDTPSYVGAPVINRMAAQSGRLDWGDNPIAIFDIDGTLANGDHRHYFIEHHPKDWEAYFTRCHLDKPIWLVIDMLHALREEGYSIAIVSGRPDTYYTETNAWFKKHSIPYDWIFMRGRDDKRPDTEIKQNILDLFPKDKIKWVFDDRPRVIEMWRKNGLRVIPVAGACPDF